eukprot:981708-Rhodomonas_salina.1
MRVEGLVLTWWVRRRGGGEGVCDVMSGGEQAMKLLMVSGAPVDEADDRGHTPLMGAAQAGHAK